MRSGVCQQGPLTPGRRLLRALSSLQKRGALQPGVQTTRARSGRSANVIPSLGAGRNTISLLERGPPLNVFVR